MTVNRLQRILSHFAEIKPGEVTISIFVFFYFFLITTPYSIIKSFRNASFLDTLGPEELPLAFLLTAVFIGFIVALHSKLQDRYPRRLLNTFSLVFFILTGFLFWLFFPRKWEWLPIAFWIWANILIVVLVTQFWMTVNDVFNPREAKRLIGFIGSGGILGGLTGGILAGLLAKTRISQFLLLLAFGMLFACVWVVNYISVWQRKARPAPDKTAGEKPGDKTEVSKLSFRDFIEKEKSYYLKLLAAVVTITLIVSTLIDFQFNSVVDNRMSGLDNLTSFFGYFNAGLMVVPFFLQLLITSRFIKRYGIRFALLVFPIVLLLCSLGIAVVPLSVLVAIIIKGSDKSLSFSLNQSVRELLYIPVSPEIKYRAKVFIDMFLNRFAKGIGAVLLIVLLKFHLDFRMEIRYVSLIASVLILGWIIINLKISKEYVNIVNKKLSRKWERADKLISEKIDVDYAKLIFDTIESKDRSSVLYAMHVFDLIKKKKLTPEVGKLISYKPDKMRMSSLGTLFDAEETAWIPEAGDFTNEETLKEEIREIMLLKVYQEVMKDHVEEIIDKKGKETETAKMEVAKAIGLMEPHSPLIESLEKLLEDESPEVCRYAVESTARLKRREYVPVLIQKLQDSVIRRDACAALEKYGSKIVGTLADYLRDPEEPLNSRRDVASILASISTQEAVDFLTWELAIGDESIETELIDALDQIRSGKPRIKFPEGIIKRKIASEIKRYCRMAINFYDSMKKRRKEKNKEPPRSLYVALMNIFKLLGLIFPHDEITKAYQNIRAGTKDSVAYAVELLDNLLSRSMKEAVFPIIEDFFPEEKVRVFKNLLKNFPELWEVK